MKNKDKKQLEQKARDYLDNNMPLDTEFDTDDQPRMLEELKIRHIELELQNQRLHESSQELEVNKMLYESLFNFSPNGIFMIDHEMRIKNVNIAGSELLRSNKHELTDSKLTKFIHPDSQDRFYFHIQRINKEKEKNRCEIHFWVNNQNIPVRIDTNPQIVPGEEQVSYLVSATDISEEQKNKQALIELNQSLDERISEATEELQQTLYQVEHTNEELRNTKERLELSLWGGGLAWWDWDYPSGRVDFSEKKAEMIGYKPSELRPHVEQFTSMIHPDDYEATMDAMAKHLRMKSNIYQAEYRLRTKDGGWTWLLDRGMVTKRDDEGNVLRVSGIVIDITEKKKVELKLLELNETLEKKVDERTSELQKAKEKEERANRAKSEFLANISHEIRTPLNAMLGFTEILKDRMIDQPEKLEYLKGINSSGRSLLNLINDILDLSKIEAGKFSINHLPVRLRAIFNELNEIFSLKAKEKNLEYLVDIDPELPEVVVFDEIRFRQIMFNLIGNAVKFTNEGKIHVEVRALEVKQDKLDLKINITDTGIGIPPEQLEEIFEPFNQQNSQDNRKYGGTGLGLSITKRLTDMMGGSLKLKSTVNEGSTFTVSFRDVPLDKKASTPNIPEAEKDPAVQRENIVENQDIANALVEKVSTHDKQEVFIQHFDKLINPLLEKSKRSMAVNHIKVLGQEVEETGKRFQLKGLAEIGISLQNYCDTFQFGMIIKLLDRLHEISYKIKKI